MKRNANSARSESSERASFYRQNLTRFASVFLGMSFILVFSTNAFGIVCTGIRTDFSESSNRAYIAEAPHDPVRYYMVGLFNYCGGKEAKGVNYMERASDMEHIVASYILGLYYRTDRGSNPSKMMPEVQENFDAAVFYYERTASYIEAAAAYPYNTHTDVPELEGKNYMSISTFINLSELYYKGYVRAIREMLKKNVSYTDTIKVLVKMQSAAERCLRRPSLSVWKGRQSEIANTKKVKCGAYKTFADKAFILESQRKQVAKRCDAPLKDCPEHKKMVSQLVRASKVMGKQVRSVPNF
ncbi:MAG: hypothetical protein OXL41_15505 [Nitrospinae bacterium]|nr:hypothetical protein [Nitrospinota bacterium]